MTSRPAAASSTSSSVGSGWTRPEDPEQAEQVLLQLQQKIQSLPTIEQAKGILMARFGVDADVAFALLVRWSQASNVKLRVICTSLVEAPGRAGALDSLIDALQQGADGAGTR